MVTEKEDAAISFARNVVNTKYEDIPSEAIEVSKTDILDALGVALASSTTMPVCRKVADLVKEMGGKEESTIIAFGGKVPCYMAAFVNATLVHSLNYNDLYDAYAIHPGCILLHSGLAAAERAGKVGGKEFIAAYTLGMDIMGRLGRAAYPPVLIREWGLYGWLMTQLTGYFGAAAVAGSLLGLDEDKMVSTFGLAYCQTAGNMEPLYGTGADKGIYPSYPAKAGVLSALTLSINCKRRAPRSMESSHSKLSSGIRRILRRLASSLRKKPEAAINTFRVSCFSSSASTMAAGLPIAMIQ